MRRAAPAAPTPRRQQGAFVIVFALALVPLLGLIGLALDVTQMYSRKAELQNVADGAALAAAAALNGTSGGVTTASVKAGAAASANKYQFSTASVVWNDAALTFGTSSTGPWLTLADAQAAPVGVLFAKVDTSLLDAAHGSVALQFMRVVAPTITSATITASAVAGRPALALAALAICAQNPVAQTSKSNSGGAANAELVEFGFRRGLGYDLLNMPVVGAAPISYVVNPAERVGDTCQSAHMQTDFIAPFLRAGTSLTSSLPASNAVYVNSAFTAATVTAALNTRFGQYGGANTLAAMSAPDSNIRSFVVGSTAANYMTPVATAQTAAASPTIAAHYGLLWAYAIPLRFNAPNTPFAKTDWNALYPVTSGTQLSAKANYPAAPGTPYAATAGAFWSAGTNPVALRRVLNVPLLNCSVAPPAAGQCQSATVLGVGKFLMTVPATATNVYAEFGGATALGAAAAPSSSSLAVLYK
jgi:Flp pilus assembly protein TadG